MGCMVQSNSIGSTFQTAFGVPSWIIGIILVVICGFIFLGGVKRLAAVTEKLVPTMAGLFLLGALLVLIIRFRHIPETFGMIFRYAFQPQAITAAASALRSKLPSAREPNEGSSPMKPVWDPPHTPMP